MRPEVSFINDLIRDVRNQCGLTLEHVAALTDFSVSAISRYELGEREVPALYAKRLREITRHVALIQWFIPEVDLSCLCVARPIPPPGDPLIVLDQVLEANEDTAISARNARKIVADGKVDELDDAAIRVFLDQANKAIDLLSGACRAVLAWRESGSRPVANTQKK